MNQSMSPIPGVPILNVTSPETTNYLIWRHSMVTYLENQGLWEVIEPKSVPKDNKAWRIKNKVALDAIRMTCDPLTWFQIYDVRSAIIAWNTLAAMYKRVNLDDPSMIALFGVNFGDLSGLTKPPSIRMVLHVGVPAVLHFDVDNKRFAAMYAVIYKGSWADLKPLLEYNPTALTAKASATGHMLIHLAAIAGNEEITQQLAKSMNPTDLEVQDSYGATALTYAAYNGMIKTVECLLSLNDKLLLITDSQRLLPVTWACHGAHHETTRFLYSRTPIDWFYPQNGYNGSTLLWSCFAGRIFDVALDLIRRCPSLTLYAGYTTAFLALGSKATEFDSSNLNFWKRWIYSLIHVQVPDTRQDEFRIQVSQLSKNSNAPGGGLFWYTLKLLGVEQIYEMKWKHAYASEILRFMCYTISFIKHTELPEGVVLDSPGSVGTLKACPQMYYADIVGLTEAVENGTIESVIEIVKACPHRMFYVDIFGRHMIMAAISYRREEVYSLIYGLKAENTAWINHVDYFGNNMLHLAGMLAPPSSLAKISGAALQMQRELQWFKEVESIVQPYQKEMENMDGETPDQVFENSHKQLMADGEKWMKETATSSTVVAALIITIMFAAIFTVPTPSKLENKIPSFSYKKTYLVFVISDSISLFSSSTSVLMFLGILTSRYAREDFLKSLPTKLIIGLSTLFFSIATMVMAFCSTLMIMLEGQLHLVVPIILLASLPVTLYIYLQFPLLVEIFIYTCGPGIFNKNIKPWY